MSRAEMRDAILKEALKSLPTDETEAKKILLKAVYAARRIEVPRTELIGVQYREFDNYSWASPFLPSNSSVPLSAADGVEEMIDGGFLDVAEDPNKKYEILLTAIREAAALNIKEEQEVDPPSELEN